MQTAPNVFCDGGLADFQQHSCSHKVSGGYPGNCRLAGLTTPGERGESGMRSEFSCSRGQESLLGKRGSRPCEKGGLGSLICSSFVEVSTARR